MEDLPTQEQCLNYFNEYKVPENIKQHCIKVQEVAVFLAKKLHDKGIVINVQMVECAALLHDLFKMAAINDITPNQYHNQTFSDEELKMRENLRERFPRMFENEIAYEVFKEEFPKLAITIKREGDPHNNEKNWEEKIIHYADSIIFKDEIVTLDERYSYFMEKYKAPDGFWDEKLNDVKQEESKIFSIIELDPKKLKQEIKND